MLFRFFDCGIYDSDREPATTVWIDAPNSQEAGKRAESFLAIAWNVPADKVCVQATGTMEFDVLRDAIEGEDAGDRRLWASGSWGERPLYFPLRALIAAGAKDRRRLLDAYKAAQAHALVLADEVTAEARALREAGNVREAEYHEYEVKHYRDFAAADLI